MKSRLNLMRKTKTLGFWEGEDGGERELRVNATATAAAVVVAAADLRNAIIFYSEYCV